MNYPNTLSDIMLAGGTIAGGATGALIGSAVPGIGSAVGTAVGAIAGATFSSVVGNTDIVMPIKSDLRKSRGVMSHEYGHYEFCSLIYKANAAAVDHLIWANIVAGDNTEVPVRYTNEAMADFFMGQVTSGSNYHWMNGNVSTSSGDVFCSANSSGGPACFDENFNKDDDGTARIARVSTMFQDMFDGHSSNGRKANVPQDADAWVQCVDDPMMPVACNTTKDCSGNRMCTSKVCTCLGLLSYSPVSGNGDADVTSAVGIPEKVHLSGKEMKKLTAELAAGMAPFVQYTFGEGFEAAGSAITETKIHKAINATLVEAKANWCDRCVLMALHDVNFTGPFDAGSMFPACMNDPGLKAALNEAPPEPNGRIRAIDCSACGANETMDKNGNCAPCLVGEVVGNSCNQCQSDVVLDGATMDFNTVLDIGQPTPGDNCPDTFWVEVKNPSALFARNVDDFNVTMTPNVPTPAICARSWSLSKGFPDPMTSYYTETTSTGTGTFETCTPGGPGTPICIDQCLGLPSQNLTTQEAMASVVRFGTPVVPAVKINLFAHVRVKPPG
jgi:hypothetical protein